MCTPHIGRGFICIRRVLVGRQPANRSWITWNVSSDVATCIRAWFPKTASTPAWLVVRTHARTHVARTRACVRTCTRVYTRLIFPTYSLATGCRLLLLLPPLPRQREFRHRKKYSSNSNARILHMRSRWIFKTALWETTEARYAMSLFA